MYVSPGKFDNNMLHVLLFIFTQFSFICFIGGVHVDFTSPLVFDPQFYINTNYDLHSHHIDTIEEAKQHWIDHGIKEGKQACGSFHSKQYIARYHDLFVSFGHNYTAAVLHYLTHQHEHRYGYKEGGFEGRWTASNHMDIFISASSHMGGAIDSLVWNNKEMINSYDHGRELQMACNTDIHGECYNPTEAGGRDDATTGSTKTHIKWVRAAGHILESEVNPAFWLRPRTHEDHTTNTKSCTKGDDAINQLATYQYPFWKKVTIGIHNIANCIEFISNFTIGGNWPRDITWIQMEAPTGYMPLDFTEKYNFNIGKTLVEYYHTNHLPAVLSTSDGLYAMGAYAPDGQDTDRPVEYGAMGFTHKGSYVSKTNKWNVVFRKRPFNDGHVHNLVYKSYICIGTLNMVSNCLHQITGIVPRV